MSAANKALHDTRRNVGDGVRIFEAHLNDLFCQNTGFRFGRKGLEVDKALKSGGNLTEHAYANKSPSCRLIVPINTHR